MVAIKILIAISAGVGIMIFICGLTVFGIIDNQYWWTTPLGAFLFWVWLRLWPKFVFRCI